MSLLVLQPSPFCNLDCDYCYLPDRSATHRMALPTLRRIIEHVTESNIVDREFTIVWHAGEPLAVPISWYAAAFDAIAEVVPDGIQVRHSFQSNGTLLTPAWCEFIRERHISIGLSIDGPARLHDLHRQTRAGRGTHAAAMRGAALLAEYDIPFHTISVVTAAALDAADEIYDFFRDHGIWNLAFNIEETEGIHETSTLEATDTDTRIRRFYRRLFERQRADAGRMRIREFDAALHRIRAGALADPPNEQTRPLGIISVDWQGNFSTYSPELLGVSSATYGDFTFGSLVDGSLLDAARTPKFQRMLADIQAGVAQCRAECAYFGLCGGGAPANKYFENGTFASRETMYCRYAIQLPIDIVLEDLESASVTPPASPGGF